MPPGTLTDLGKYALQAETCEAIFADRNALYGGSFRVTGLLGAVLQLTGEIDKLRNMTLRSESSVADLYKIQDSLRDIINYGHIGLINLEEGNWDGIDPDRN